MARVRLLKKDEVAPEAREMYEEGVKYGPFQNQIAVLAHRPPILNNLFRLFMAIREEETLPRRYLEIALVGTSQLDKCTYCVSHHTPMLEVQGLSREGIERLVDYEDHPELTEPEKLIMELCTKMVQDHHRIRDDVFDRLRKHFSEAQIVELLFRISLTIGLNRFNDVLQIDIEEQVAPIPM